MRRPTPTMKASTRARHNHALRGRVDDATDRESPTPSVRTMRRRSAKSLGGSGQRSGSTVVAASSSSSRSAGLARGGRIVVSRRSMTVWMSSWLLGRRAVITFLHIGALPTIHGVRDSHPRRGRSSADSGQSRCACDELRGNVVGARAFGVAFLIMKRTRARRVTCLFSDHPATSTIFVISGGAPTRVGGPTVPKPRFT
jgi:hypothetical protein